MLRKLFPRLIFILLITLAILPRFIFLNSVPVGINNDELHYVLNAKSFLVTGKDITGKITPLDILLFKYPNDETIQAELPYFLEMPLVGLLNFSLTNTILPNLLFGLLTVFLVYLIASKLFDRKTAAVASLLALINPWLIFLGRTTYEGGIATCLFILVFYLLLVTKGWKILLSIPVALLAFYSNIGTKLIFFPFVLLSVLYAYYVVNNKKFFKQYALLLVFSLLLTLLFVFQVSKNQGTRTSEIITPENSAITKQVNDMRKTTIGSPLMKLSENKYYVYFTILEKNAFNALSPYYLFAGGDYFYLTGIHGIFYYIDAVFLAVGFIAMYIFRKKSFIFLSMLSGLSLVPQILHDTSGTGNFTHHIVLLIPCLILFISFGISKSMELIKNPKYKNIFTIFLVLVYSFLFLNFLNSYFFRFPLQDATFNSQNRILAKYLSFTKNSNQDVMVYSRNPREDFRSFLFYSNTYTVGNISSINKSMVKGNYTYGNISFLSCNDNFPKNALIINATSCKKNPSGHSFNIVQLKDSGSSYGIYGDKTCKGYKLPGYIANLALPDLNIENLNQQKFCEKFIVSY